MMDRILLLLLLLLLPAGIITSRFVSGELKVGSGMSPLQEKKLEVLFERVNSQTTDTKPKRNPINITSVVYASESGVLRVGGVVPDSKQFVWVYIAGTLHKEGKKTASGSSEPQSLTVSQPIAIKPSSNSFNVELPVEEYRGTVEVRVQHSEATMVVQYDLDGKKQVVLQ